MGSYGVLHHEKYKKKFTSNLSKELPRIPMAPNFHTFKTAGRKLADLHIHYETCKKYPLKPKAKFGKLVKMAFPKVTKNGKKIPDKTRLFINGIEVFDLPEIKYTVNGRTPIEWVIDRYRKTTDKDSGIVNDPTETMTEEKTIAMIQRLVYVGAESDKIIKGLPKEFEPTDWDPSESVGVDQAVRSYDALAYIKEELRKAELDHNYTPEREKYIKHMRKLVKRAEEIADQPQRDEFSESKIKLEFTMKFPHDKLLKSITLRDDGTWQPVTKDANRRTYR